MSSVNGLTEEVSKYCNEIGVDIVGFADPLNFNRFNQIYRPFSFLKSCKTVIVIGFHLFDISLDAWNRDEEKEKSSHFADLILINQCHRIKNFLAKKGLRSKIVSYEPGLYLKDAAALAGMGPIGKNNLFITERYGSQIRLRALVTEAPLVVGNPINESKYCKNCDICIEACPANAFSEGKYNKDACLTYCQANLRNLSDKTVLWCNICIECCPIGKDGIHSIP